MTQTKQARHTAPTEGEWFARGTAGHETHGQWAIYTDTGSTIAVVYDGKAHAERIVKAVNSHEELLGALQAIVARINGEFDNPALVAFGPLSTSTSNDCEQIASRAIEKAHATGE